MGAWIEIANDVKGNYATKSLLSWERGLKLSICKVKIPPFFVAPLVGAWIEILSTTIAGGIVGVAPLVGAWIEIYSMRSNISV